MCRLCSLPSLPTASHTLPVALFRMNIIAAEVDLKLNKDKYIVPGLGDAGDRYFGTVEH